MTRAGLAVLAALVWLVTGVVYGPSWLAGRLWFCIIKACRWARSASAEGFTAGAHPGNGNDGPDRKE
jgi:hypothetical protein